MEATHTAEPWTAGSSGNYFRDLASARYCVAHETVGYKADGRRHYKFSANRNGIQIGSVLLYDTADEAKGICDADALKAAGTASRATNPQAT